MKKKMIHDTFMKEWLSDPEIAQEFLSEILPSPILKELHVHTLTPQPTTYVSSQLRTHFSDLVWRVGTRTGSVHISLLLEHTSYRDPKAVFQPFHYVANGYLEQVKNGKPWELIIPILYYHGTTHWKIEKYFHLF